MPASEWLKKAEDAAMRKLDQFADAVDNFIDPPPDKRGEDKPWRPRRRSKHEKNILDGVANACLEIKQATTDPDVHTIIRRAIGLYRDVVRHVAKGGRVDFVFLPNTIDEYKETLKVKLKDNNSDE